MVEGRLQTRSWADKQGVQRKTTEIIAERLQLGPRPAGGGQAPRTDFKPSAGAPSNQKESPVEEIPVINLEDESGDIKAEDLPF